MTNLVHLLIIAATCYATSAAWNWLEPRVRQFVYRVFWVGKVR